MAQLHPHRNPSAFPDEPAPGTGPLDHIAFNGVDFDEIADGCAGMASKRASLVPGNGLRQLFFNDPNGIKIEINIAGTGIPVPVLDNWDLSGSQSPTPVIQHRYIEDASRNFLRRKWRGARYRLQKELCATSTTASRALRIRRHDDPGNGTLHGNENWIAANGLMQSASRASTTCHPGERAQVPLG